MKNIKYLFFTFLGFSLMPFYSCLDEEKQGGRFPDFQDAANMRIIVDPEFSSINADDPASAKVLLDFYSENVDDVAKVDLYIDFFDFSDGTTTDRSFLKNVPLNSFSGGIFRGFEISFNDIKSALGLNDSDFDGLDQITIYNETTMKDGRIYPGTIQIDPNTSFSNVTPNIQNSTATTSFTSSILIFVQCPLPAGFATGKYLIEQVSGPNDPFFGNETRWAPGEVTVSETGPIRRTFTGKYFTFDVTFNFVVTCGTLVVPKGDSGLSCGGPSITWIQDGINTYSDDAEFIITLLDNIDGACGLPVGEKLVLKLTRI